MSLVLTTRDEEVPSVALLTMNKAESMNSYNMALHTALLDSIQAADKDPSVRVIVVTGAGRAFCAGADHDIGTSLRQGNRNSFANSTPRASDDGEFAVQ